MRQVEILKDPLVRFNESFRSKATKESYQKKLRLFLQFVSATPQELVEKAITDPQAVDNLLLEYIRIKKDSVSGSTIGLTRDALKRFLVVNRAHKQINWEEIAQYMPKARKIGRDRAPSAEEIRKLLKFCSPRMRCVVLLMCSSGIRVGAFDYLRWGDLDPVDVDDKKIGKLTAYAGEDEQYTTFITPECYDALLEYARTRKLAGEEITSQSPMITVEKWNRVQDKGKPLAVSSKALSNEIGKLWTKAGFRQSHKKTHEFKQVHGFRKFFRTKCENAGVSSVFVEFLMGHSGGLAGNYTKPTTPEFAEQYARAISSLTLSEVEEIKNTMERKVAQSDRHLAELERENLLLRHRLDRVENNFSDLKDMIRNLKKTS